MVEIRRGSDVASGGDRLPWLEPVEDEDDGGYGAPGDEPGGYGGVMLAALVVLVAIAAITAGIVWFRHHRAATADIGEVIHPDPGPYKVKPAAPGGLDTTATGQVAAGTSAGEDIDSVLDLNAVPEQPVATRARPGAAPAAPQANAPPQPGAPQSSAPQPAPTPAQPTATGPAQPAAAKPALLKPAPPKPAPPKPAPPKPAPIVAPEAAAPIDPAAGGAVQLGAFSTEAKAKAVWKSLSSRFHYLQDMTPVILPVQAGDAKLFRLRASGGTMAAGRICGQLRVAGETCAVVAP